MVSTTKIEKANNGLNLKLQRNELHGGNFKHLIRLNHSADALPDLPC